MGRRLVAATTMVVMLFGMTPPVASLEQPRWWPTKVVRIQRRIAPPLQTTVTDRDVRQTSISASGRWIAFSSQADDLVPGDTNVGVDVFVTDAATGRVQLVSRGLQGAPAIGGHPSWCIACAPSISANGRFIAFQAAATNLVNGDTNAVTDVFVFDRVSRDIERVSVNTKGEQGDAFSYAPSISGDGRFVSFTSTATNLVPDDRNAREDIFVHDRTADRTTRVSVTSAGKESGLVDCLGTPTVHYLVSVLICRIAFTGARSSISANGRIIAFDSPAADLVAGDNKATWDVFTHDRQTKKTTLISVPVHNAVILPDTNLAGPASRLGPYYGQAQIGDGGPATHHVSANGRFIAFSSLNPALVPNDVNGAADAFVRDRVTGRTERVSVTSIGEQTEQGWNSAYDQSISGNGRYVTFSPGQRLVAEPEGGFHTGATFRHDRLTGELVGRFFTERKVNAKAVYYDGPGDLNHDGRYVAYPARISALKPDGGYRHVDGEPADVYRWDLGSAVSSAGSAHDVRDVSLAGSHSQSWSGLLARRDRAGDTIAPLDGADLVAAQVAQQRSQQQLFAALDVAALPSVSTPVGSLPAVTGVVYGLRFSADATTYEVRAEARPGAPGGAVFGLFECAGTCTKLRALSGGFGTTGHRVTVGVPLSALGLDDGGEIRHMTGFSGFGSLETGAVELIDEIALTTDS